MSRKNRSLKEIRRNIEASGSLYRDTIYANPRFNVSPANWPATQSGHRGTVEVSAYCGRAQYRNYKSRSAATGYRETVNGPVL